MKRKQSDSFPVFIVLIFTDEDRHMTLDEAVQEMEFQFRLQLYEGASPDRQTSRFRKRLLIQEIRSPS